MKTYHNQYVKQDIIEQKPDISSLYGRHEGEQKPEIKYAELCTYTATKMEGESDIIGIKTEGVLNDIYRGTFRNKEKCFDDQMISTVTNE